MAPYSKDEIRDLIDGKLPWPKAKAIISAPKDDDRFDKYLEILQERVPWKERILLPLGEHLYIAEKDGERIVKCDCGYEYGDYRENWKLKALIYVRDTEEKLDEVFFGPRKPSPKFCSVREYYCPGCGAQLEVETVPVGYPAIFDFLPNLDAFYGEWLGRPLETEKEFKDLTYELTRKWGEQRQGR
jgi:acetone carboxylase gamma subunit